MVAPGAKAWPGPVLRPCAASLRPALAADPAGRAFFRSLSPIFRLLPLLGGEAAVMHAGGRSRLASALLSEAPWAAPLADALDVHLSLRALSSARWIGWRPLCLVGPSGSGKSWLAGRLAMLSGTASATLDVGGGHVRPFEGRLRPHRAASLPVTVMAATLAANPVIVLDGVERIAARSDWALQADALRAMVTHDCARDYFDVGLQQAVDVAEICWIMTCSQESWLPSEVASRVHIVRLLPPEPRHVPAIVKSMVATVAGLAGVDARLLPRVADVAVDALAASYARNASLWSLRRGVEAFLAAALRDGAVHAH